MKRYLAFLRAVNISGKNKVPMGELKKQCELSGFSNVKTYLNSGNIVFTSEEADALHLAQLLHEVIESHFQLDIQTLVVNYEELLEELNDPPQWWGTGDEEIYDNLILIFPFYTAMDIQQKIGMPKENYEWIECRRRVIFWSFIRKDYTKTNWWAKTASPEVNRQLTIRTANTIRKLIGFCEQIKIEEGNV